MLCVSAGVTWSLAPWDAKSSIDRLFVSLASMYLDNQVIYHPILQVFTLILPPARSSATYPYNCDLAETYWTRLYAALGFTPTSLFLLYRSFVYPLIASHSRHMYSSNSGA